MAQVEKNKPQDRMDRNEYQDKKNFHLRPKVFRLQESTLCQTLETKAMRPTYTLILSFCIYFCLTDAINHLVNPNEFVDEINYTISLFKHIELFILQHVIFTALILFVFYPTTKLWIKLRTELDSKTSLIDFGFSMSITSIIDSIFFITTTTILRLDINIAIGSALIIDKIRFAMKTIAIILEIKRKQETALEKDKNYAEFPTYGQLIYFLVAPTLVYRDEYPRLERRDYTLLAKLVLQQFLCLYFMLVIHFRVFIPSYSKIATGAFCLLGFYFFLHLYMNMWSQILLFGDRVFYEDWWTCSDYSTYYRKWNILVRDWIHAYLFSPFTYLFKGNRVLAGLSSIYLSALIHEYIIAVGLRHINPFLSFLFGGFGAFLFTIKVLQSNSKLKKIKKEYKEKNLELENHHPKKEIDLNYKLANTFLLFTLLSGWFLIIAIYNISYFSRKNCMNDTGVFVPPSLIIECMKFKF